MPAIAFNRYYRYDDLTNLLKALAEEHPDLLRLESVGKSHEGRDVWLMTATNFATGPDIEKPALWVDGNLHASEVASSMAVLYFINTLVTRYGQDANITAALDTRAFYAVPRVNPDGAEWALADKPKIIRSSTRPYPYDEEPVEGLLEEDIDGDGRILTMRIADPNGTWKAQPDEARLMIRPRSSRRILTNFKPIINLLSSKGITLITSATPGTSNWVVPSSVDSDKLS